MKPTDLLTCMVLACLVQTSRMECVDRLELEEVMEAMQTLQMKVKTLEETVALLKAKDGQSNSNNQEKRLLLTESEMNGIAFSVSVSPLDISNLGAGQTVRFDKVIANLGNGYNNNTGIFTAPIQGWYVFSLTLMDNPGEEQRLDVVKDGVHVFHCYVNGDEFDTASRTMVFQVNKGSTVWVQTNFASTSRVHGDEHTSLTGFLLYPYV